MLSEFSWTTLLLTASVAAAPMALQDVLNSWKQSPLSRYPTDFTRDIATKHIHSHNDYWREVPLYSAISVGAVSVEADVWLVNDTLYVGHEQAALTANRTFKSLYVDPILSTLQKQNPQTPFVSASASKNGVFDTDAGQTLYLWVDIKTSGEEAWPVVIEALQPLRDAGYLTSLSNSTTITPGPVTVIGTGNTPLSQIAPVSTRDYFFDGPLLSLATGNFTAAISPIASVDFNTAIGKVSSDQGLNDTQLQTLQKQIDDAEALGIHVRYWDLPAWPVSTRNKVWRQLVTAGVFLLNVDDLAAGSGLAGPVW